MSPQPPNGHPANGHGRDDRDELRALEQRADELLALRRSLLDQARKLSGEQRSLYDRRHGSEGQAEGLHRTHTQLGRKLGELRVARDQARAKVEDAVIRRRELLLTFDPAEREKPEKIRKEIAELERRQQTTTLSIDEEKSLVALLRQRTADLQQAEARAGVVADHARLREEADAAVAAARADVDRLGQEMVAAQAERDRTMVDLRDQLQGAGTVVADLRAKGAARAEAMKEVERVSRELEEVNAAGRALLARFRERREEFARTARQNQLRRRPQEEALASIAEENLTQLLKRGKITL